MANDEYFDKNTRDSFKPALYQYLVDKARRRSEATSKSAYDAQMRQIGEDEWKERTNAFIGGLSQDMSMLGSTANGFVAKSTTPEFMKGMNQATQNRYDRIADLRKGEEIALGTDANIAKAIVGADSDNQDRQLRRRGLNIQESDQNNDRELARQQLYEGLKAKAADRGVDQGRLDETGRHNRAMEGLYGKGRGPGGEKPHAWSNMQGTDESGNPAVMQIDPHTGKSRPVPLPKGFTPYKKGGADPKDKPLTEGERTAAMYYNNAENALRILEEMEAKGHRPKGTTGLKEMVPGAWQGYAYDAEEAKYKQAAEDYTAAKLRLESGANIPPSEIEQQARIYMARPGERDDLLQQKQTSRRKALQGLQFKAGRGAEQIRQMDGQPSAGSGNSSKPAMTVGPIEPNSYTPETGPTPRQDPKNTQQPWTGGGKKVAKKFYSPSTNKTKLIYEDGSEEVVDGKR